MSRLRRKSKAAANGHSKRNGEKKMEERTEKIYNNITIAFQIQIKVKLLSKNSLISKVSKKYNRDKWIAAHTYKLIVYKSGINL